MRPILALVLLILASCRPDTLVPRNSCGTECYIGNQGKVGVGACSYGTWVCPDDDESKRVCEGSTQPTEEVCDGIDNDCDGEIDELATCCKNPVPEICNGKDDDCDGIIDNLKLDPKDAVCYQGPKETLSYRPCGPGVWRCMGSSMVCDGQTLPAAEVCDGVDNDCDGIVDDGVNVGMPVDLVFVVDNSGSMAPSFPGPRKAVRGFSTTYGFDPTIKWALVAAPSTDPISVIPTLEVALGPVDPFKTAFELQNGTTGSGNEPTLDALLDICTPTDPFGLGWTKGSMKTIVLFTDEPPQSYRTPAVTDIQVRDACKAMGIPIYGFVTYNGGLPDFRWGQIIGPTGGRTSDIRSYNIEAELVSVVRMSTCRGPQ